MEYYLVRNKGWEDWEIIKDECYYIDHGKYDVIINIKEDNLKDLKEQLYKMF